MDYRYSKTMKALLKRKPSLAVQIFLLFITAILTFVCIISLLPENDTAENQEVTVKEFDPFSPEESYSKLTPQFLSEEFAANYNDTVYYCFAVDTDYNTYVVAVSANDMDKYQDLIDYTYNESITTPPAEVTLQGMPVEFDEDTINFSIEAYNNFWGSDTLNAENFKTILGSCYLDTTQTGSSASEVFIPLLLMVIALVMVYIFLWKKAESASKRRKATLNKYDKRTIWEIDQELNQPDTLRFDAQKLYMTNHGIVSSASGFDIVSYDEIVHVYGGVFVRNSKVYRRSVIAVTGDGIKHEIAYFGTSDADDKLIGYLVEQIKTKLPEIPYGADNENFYMLQHADNGIELDTDPEGKPVKSNLLLGFIGAILGAAIGGVIWIIIGELGFIAGLAGYLMMFFALKGYRWLSGSLDKKGQIISLIIAFVMIFAANYALYALQYCEGYYNSNYSFGNLVSSFKDLPGFLGMPEVFGSFIKDLVVGYLLSIWAGFRLIGAVFTQTPKKDNTGNK